MVLTVLMAPLAPSPLAQTFPGAVKQETIREADPPVRVEIRLIETSSRASASEIKVKDTGEVLRVSPMVWLSEQDIASASVTPRVPKGFHLVFALTYQGTRKFRELTVRHVGHRLAVLVNNTLLAAPEIRSAVSTGKIHVSLNHEEEGKKIAARINDLAQRRWEELGRGQQRSTPLLFFTVRDDATGQEIVPENGLVTVANHKRIGLEIRLRATSVGDEFEPLSVAALNQPTVRDRKPTVELSVKKISGGKRSPVPIRLFSSGGGKSLTLHYVSTSFDILGSAKERAAKIKKFLAWMQTQQEQEGRGFEFRSLTRMAKGMTAYFDSMYVDNSPGNYEIVATYTSRQPGAWNGTLRSRPLRLRVVYETDSFELLKKDAQTPAESAGRGFDYYRGVRIDPVSLMVQLDEPIPGSAAPTGSYYHRWRAGQRGATISHFEKKVDAAPPVLYNRLEVDVDGRVIARSKSQLLLEGPFGRILAQTRYFYSEDSGDQATEFFTVPDYYGNPHEPAQILDQPPAGVPRNLSAISLVRIFRAPPEYLIVSVNYASDGNLESLHVNGTKDGKWVHSSQVAPPDRSFEVATMIGDRPGTRARFGLPRLFPIKQYLSQPQPVWPAVDLPPVLEAVHLHYERNRWVRQDVFFPDGTRQSRFLLFAKKPEDEQLEPLDEQRVFGQFPRTRR